MRRNEIRYEILVFSLFFVELPVFRDELFVNPKRRLIHTVKHGVVDMLGRDFKLTADVIGYEFPEKRPVGIVHKIIESYSAPDENLPDLGQSPEPSQKRKIPAVIDFKVRTGFPTYTLPVGTNAAFELFIARGTAEIRRRTAYVVNIALEVGHFRKSNGFSYDRIGASRLNYPSLMKGNRAETAIPETASVSRKTEFHLVNRRNLTERLEIRMDSFRERKVVNRVHFLFRERNLRLVYDDVFSALLFFEKNLPRTEVVVSLLTTVRLRVRLLVRGNLAVRRKNLYRRKIPFLHALFNRRGKRFEPAHISRTANVFYLAEGNAFFKSFGYIENGSFAHPVYEKVGSARFENARKHLIRPIIVMTQPTQTGFDSADNHSRFGINALYIPRIELHRSVRSFGLSSGSVDVLFPSSFRDGIVIDHTVHGSARNQESYLRLSESLILRVAPRVIQNGYAESEALEKPRYKRVSERRVIDVSLGRNHNEIGLPSVKLFGSYGEKALRSEHSFGIDSAFKAFGSEFHLFRRLHITLSSASCISPRKPLRRRRDCSGICLYPAFRPLYCPRTDRYRVIFRPQE